MTRTLQETMKAAAIDRFGGIDTVELKPVPTPDIGPDQVLIRVESAGLGPWDAAEREGLFARRSGAKPAFPYVLGSEGAGTVLAVGDRVKRFRQGDRVYGVIMQRHPKGGFLAPYAALDAARTWAVPGDLPTLQAGALAIDGATALRGLRDVLKLESDETLMIFGAGGGIGHLAVQLAKRMGANVLAVASGEDGVALARQLGADAAVEGHHANLVAAAHDFARNGVDAALLTAGGDAAGRALGMVRKGGRAAYPHGVQPLPEAPPGLRLDAYSASYDTEFMEALKQLIEAGPFEVHLDRAFPLDEVADAFRALTSHYLGRLVLRPS